MTKQISTCERTNKQSDYGLKKQDAIIHHEEDTLNLILKRNFLPTCGITQPASAKVLTSVRRDATEGSLLFRKLSGPNQQLGLQQQTIFGTGHKVQDKMKSININVAADKFLLGTMDALSYKESTAPLHEPGSYGPLTAFADTESGNSGHDIIGECSYNNSCEELCRPQKKSKPNPRPSRPPLLPPCRVCGDRASGYHYGVNTCEACKGFFRRSICKTEAYVCAGSGDCKTVAGKRTACSHCRFKRCIEVGMSKNAIKTGRYTHELRSRNILEVKRLQKQGSEESPERTPDESLCIDTCYTEYKNDLLRKSVLEETLNVLVSGQKMLYEFLDDYYNDDLIRERQLLVYANYIKRKGRLLSQAKSLAARSDTQHLAARSDTQHLAARSDTQHLAARSDTQHLAARSDTQHLAARSDTQHLAARSDTQHLNNQSRLINTNTQQATGNDLHTPHTNIPTSQTKLSTETRSTAESQMELNQNASTNISISTKEVSLCADTRENLTAQEGSVEADVEKCVHRVQHQSNESSTRTGNDTTGIKTDDSVLPFTESLRAEVMTKIINDLEQGVQGMLAFANCLPSFSELPSQDQVSLVKAARFDIWYIGHIRCFNVEMRVGACEWQFHAEELAQVWGNSMVDLAFTLSRVAQTLDLTKHETAALRAVCLTFSDRCMDLQNRDEVEQMHAHMLDVFKFVSCKRHSDYNKWFPKVINFLVLLREFGVKFEAVSSKLKLDWDVLKDNPVLLSVFLS